ncbi:uncharacterized protein LOC125179206, partial [Hyalella azteca]|uniref:Uncharacterized protein LOC125179206 n=1 Tax=Hyalella azteca TaxID=294128 RepID=A0A979FVL3_HYAAZ
MKLLPLLEQKGFQLTAVSVAALVTNTRISKRLYEKLYDANFMENIVHGSESGYRILLAELTKNCCRNGPCWFRSSMLTSACREFIRVSSQIPALLLLQFGVHNFTPYEDLRIDSSWQSVIGRNTYIIHRYAAQYRRLVTKYEVLSPS